MEEGAFYVWKKEQLQELLKNDFEIFAELFNINDFGYWEHDNFVLIQSQTTANLASQFGLTETELRQKKKNWEQLLYHEREKRPKPRLDDKSLTSWNALMLKGYADAYKALGHEAYLAVAEKNARFLIEKQWSSEGFLWHSYKNGKSTIPGFLEDYAFVIEAFIDLYQATLKETYLHQAKQLTDYTLEHFYDEDKQFFAFNARNSEQLIAQHFETEDNVIPASNSVMANNLYVLGVLFHNSYYEKVALQMLHHMIPYIDYASAYSNWLNLWLNLSDDQKELAVCGTEALQNLKILQADYLPNVVMAGTTGASNLPFLHHRFDQAKQFFYICRQKNCLLPNESLATNLIRIKNPVKVMEVTKINDVLNHYFNFLIDYSPRLVSALLILFIGIWGIKILRKVVERIMIKRELEPTLIQFTLDILIWGVRILLFVTVISRLGVETSSFVAILGAIGLAVGMSLQGSLSNFAGGMLIVMFKPFKVGDTIEAQGEIGNVMEIHIFTTKILTAQNQIIYIPNGVLSNGKIKNYSQKNMRRSDLIVRTNYDSDIKVMKGQLEAILKNHPKVLKSPAPDVFIHELTDSTVNFDLRVWVKNADYAKVSSDILEESKGVVKL